MAFSVVSMFSGGGGMDLGFMGGFNTLGVQYDKLPFDVVWANDKDNGVCEVYRNNIGDIIEGDGADHLHTLPEYADVVIGGFPCQDVSVNADARARGPQGGRTSQYQQMVYAIEHLSPRAFVAENVKGLLSPKYSEFYNKIVYTFSGLGYHITARLYNAKNYGVPQSRERVILVGMKQQQYIPPMPFGSVISVKHAIHDLEAVAESAEFSHIFNTATGGSRTGGRKLDPARPSSTITCSSSSLRWHYNLPRRMTPREAARVQTFPDWFKFSSRMSPAMRVIGNAVPPVLAWHIASKLGQQMGAT